MRQVSANRHEHAVGEESEHPRVRLDQVEELVASGHSSAFSDDSKTFTDFDRHFSRGEVLPQSFNRSGTSTTQKERSQTAHADVDCGVLQAYSLFDLSSTFGLMIYLKSDGIVLGQSKDVSTTLHELSTFERGSANVAE